MGIRSAYHNMTLKQYIDFNNIAEEDWVQKVEMLCGKVSIERASSYYSEIKLLESEVPICRQQKFYMVGGKLFKVNYKLSSVRADQFIDLMHFVRKERPENEIHNILAIFMHPIGKSYYDGVIHQDVANDLLNMKLKDAMPVMVFFCNYLTTLFDNIPTYLTRKVEKAKMEMDLLRNGDG